MALEIRTHRAQREANLKPLLFVHGVCHGAWCWANWQAWWAERGRSSFALSLRGHGASEGREGLNGFKLTDYAQDVERALGQIDEAVILVGHSMGGAVVQRAMQAKPKNLAAVVLLAAMPPNGMTRWESLMLRLDGGYQAFARLIGGDALSEADVRRLPFFGRGVTMEEGRRYRELLQPESLNLMGELATLSLEATPPADSPMLVIGSKDDRIIRATALRRTARHYACDLIVRFKGWHDLMLDPDWEDHAGAIEAWCVRKGL